MSNRLNKHWWHPEGKSEPDDWDPKTMCVAEPYIETADRLHIGQTYEKENAAIVECRECKGRQFEIGRGSYFTGIKCVNCRWEYCIHEG